MHYKEGKSRHQMILYPEYLDEIVNENNPVRIIDVFVEKLDLERCGFKMPELITGTPPFKITDLVKLYIYGNLNKISTSRRLEKECYRNIELRWLLKDLTPCFKTISDFRKRNRNALSNIFYEFQSFCYKLGLIDFKEVAIDGTKVYAQNSNNNVYRRDTIDKVQERIEKKMSDYLDMLDKNDTNLDQEETQLNGNVKEIIKKIEKLEKYKKKQIL